MSSLHYTVCKETRSFEQSHPPLLIPPIKTGRNTPFVTILDHAKVSGGKRSWTSKLIAYIRQVQAT